MLSSHRIVPKALAELKAAGMTAKQLSSFAPCPQSFSGASAYFGTPKELYGNNGDFAERVVFIANALKKNPNETFENLIAKALTRWPLHWKGYR